MQALLTLIGGAEPTARALGVALLVASRIAPSTLLVPWLALRATPPLLRAALLVSLSIAMTPVALATAPPLPPDALSFAMVAAREAAIGAVFAIATALGLHALDQAGRLIDAMRGASQSEATLPSGERSSPLGALHGMLGTVLFLVLGGHRLVIAALGEGFLDVPAGATVEPRVLAAFALGAARIVVASLTLAVAFAVPAAVALVATEVALGLVGRAAPAIPVHFAGMPLRAAVGIAVVFLGLAVLVPHLPRLFAQSVATGARALDALVAPAGGP